MDNTFKIFLYIHILSGATAFIAAPVAMMVLKGGNRHRRFGKLFFWSMTGVCSSGFVMSVLHPNIFLFMISGFSYYFVASGYRWVFRKRVQSVKDVEPLDWVLVVAAGVFNLALLGFGGYAIVKNPANAFGYIAGVFGIIGVRFVIQNVKQFYNPPPKNAWLLNHIGGMVGGYVATVSAFSAVNFTFLPSIIQWLWPTIIGVPLLFAWINYYRRKIFKEGKEVSELVAEIRY